MSKTPRSVITCEQPAVPKCPEARKTRIMDPGKNEKNARISAEKTDDRIKAKFEQFLAIT